jgi:hypothetical protein
MGTISRWYTIKEDRKYTKPCKAENCKIIEINVDSHI